MSDCALLNQSIILNLSEKQMKHDKEDADACETTMISTTGNATTEDQKEEEDLAPPTPNAAADDDDDQMMEDEDRAQKLNTFDKFSRGFVRAMLLTLEDVGANESHRDSFLTVLDDCFSNIIRLSGSLTGCQGPVNSMLGPFVRIVAYKASQIAESVAQSDNLQEDNQEIIDKATRDETRKLMEEVVSLYASQLAAWRDFSDQAAKAYH